MDSGHYYYMSGVQTALGKEFVYEYALLLLPPLYYCLASVAVGYLIVVGTTRSLSCIPLTVLRVVRQGHSKTSRNVRLC